MKRVAHREPRRRELAGSCTWVSESYGVGCHVKPNLHQGTLAWDPEMDEATERPPYMLMIDEYFMVYQRRRRRFVSGEAPKGINGDRPMYTRE
ncbi:MAG: hypothetical protein A3H27_17875 [Acidobacteria bacterium RIFCSPLOWO2_02_FULL_59_13]|nr:MAG: hypothetical protein A3H27_17875 [Acidobacteria bacterium RIFCSPLOWO2_02_FULL_59_13]